MKPSDVPAPPGYVFTRAYDYRSADGFLQFQKLRFESRADSPLLREKTFRYLDAMTGSLRKPPEADRIIYRLPDVLEAVRVGTDAIHWAEGEKDADALADAGAVATSIHQGAGHTTVAQARWLVGAREVVIWVDKDTNHWEVGAYDAVLRYKRLRECGVPDDRIRFVRARGPGKDAYDHLLQYSLSRAVPVDRRKLASVAARYRVGSGSFLGYRRG